MMYVVALPEKHRGKYPAGEIVKAWLVENMGYGHEYIYDGSYNVTGVLWRYRELFAITPYTDGNWHSDNGTQEFYAVAFFNSTDAELFKLTWGGEC